MTFFHLVKWFLRFPPVTFLMSRLRTGIFSCWNFKVVFVPTLLQLTFSCGIAIVDIPVMFLVFVVTNGLTAAAVPLVLFSRAFSKSLQVFFNFYSKEN